ncbi:MAG: peptide deformylase [Oscillospiraceae bacterium]|nr:peptide deformylase [Oscillospiraceae bacterium]
MAIRRILTEDDATLRKQSRAVTNFDARLHILLDDMAETMREANGVGLAAVQTGVLRRAAVVEAEPGTLIELVNPEIVETEGEQNDVEGCLSLPGVYGMVCRPMKVTIKAQDRYGKHFTLTGEGLVARAFCHEIDHLNGVIFTAFVTEYIDENSADAPGGENGADGGADEA